MKERNSNIELLRIVAMMGVVALHYVHQDIGGVENYAVFPKFIWFFVAGVRGFAIPLVNVFVIITGYFMIKSDKLSVRKAIDLLAIMIFYGICRYSIGVVTGTEVFSVHGIMSSTLPIFYGSAWFIKTYLILYLLAPFLNKSLTRLTLKCYRMLLVIQVTIFSLWYSVGFSAPITDNGYGIVNFVTLYMIGGYLRLFMCESSILNKVRPFSAILGYFICASFTAVASIFVNPFGYCYFSNIFAASLLLLGVAKLPEKKNRIVNRLSKNAFDVFFVHGKWLFDLLHISSFVVTPWLPVHFVISICVNYFMGVFCGSMREALFSISVNRILNKSKVINRVYHI